MKLLRTIDGKVLRTSPIQVGTHIEYGYLYNHYAAVDTRNIANAGWEMPTQTKLNSLITSVGGSGVAGGKLKEVGLIYWLSPNSGATNEVGFNARGGSGRASNGGFLVLKAQCAIMASNLNTGKIQGISLGSGAVYSSIFTDAVVGEKSGYSVRLVKTTTSLTNGQVGTYTGNDGKVYRTICIGTQEWLADSLTETKYRNGDIIPEITDGPTWSGLTSGARCSYNNLESNAVSTVYAHKIMRHDAIFICPNIGDYLQGGIVVYKFQLGDPGYIAGQCHGLIMTADDISTGATWGCQGTHIVTGDGIGAGQTTTNNILAGCATPGIAARLCDEYSFAGYSDWFLPTQAEITKGILNTPSYFAVGQYYWSSTVMTTNDDRAIKAAVSTITTDPKNTSLRVKAFRYF